MIIEIPEEVVTREISKQLNERMPEIILQAKREVAAHLLENDVDFDAKGICEYLSKTHGGLNYPISRRNLTNLINDRVDPIPHFKLDRELRFRKSAVDAWRDRKAQPKQKIIRSGGGK